LENSQIAVVKEKVQRYLIDLLDTVQIDRDGDFSLRHGSARVFVRVSPLGDDGTFVAVWAITNSDVPASPELFRYLATENHYRFGHMSCFEKDGKAQVHFSHNLLGDFLDPDELKMAVFIVARTADELDDELKSKFGGRRFHED